ncbi:cache domain-containing protein [Glaciecola sp. 1036]|uniref:cache domain-containing protein n=1 Tax=Alteromonadaceae TaxID=72275 RepID=UPI003D05807D
MTPLKRNINRVVVFTLVLLLGSGISGLIYYLKIKNNESSFNTLQLRELERVEVALKESFQKIKSTTKFLQSASECRFAAASERCNKVIETRLSQMRQSPELENITLLKRTPFTIYQGEELDNQSFAEKGEIHKFDVILDRNLEFHSQLYKLGSEYTPVITHSTLHLISDAGSLLTNHVTKFPLVLIANKEGVIIGQKRFLHKDTSIFEAQFQQIEHINQIDGNPIAGSQIRDMSINNTDVRLYIKPVSGDNFFKGDDQLYLVGVVPSQLINLAKLEVSPKSLMWLILILLLIIASTPLLKLRFVSNRYAFTTGDKSQIALGLILAVGILSIAINQHLFFSYLESAKITQSKQLFNDIKSEFNQEVESIISTILTNAKNMGVIQPSTETENNSYYQNLLKTQDLVFDLKDKDKNTAKKGVIEQIAIVDASGFMSNQYPAYYVSENIFITGKLDLNHRKYVQAGLAKNYWQHKNSDKNVQPFYLQRINNIEDGRKNSMFALPFDDKNEFIIAGTRIRSLVDKILPRGFGFAVIDQNGVVQYHSDEQLSLIENFIVESANNPELQIANKNAEITTNPITMKLAYKGDDHIITIGSLSSAGEKGPALKNPLPWRLVIFYNPYELSLNNMLLVFLAVITLLIIILPSFALLRAITQQKFWTEVLFFQELKALRYRKWALFILSVSVFIMFSIGIFTELSLRLLVWATLCLGVVAFLHRRMKVDLRPYSRLTYPQTSVLCVIFVLFVLHLGLSQSIHLDYIMTNYASFIIGCIILTGCYFLVIRRAKQPQTLAPSECLIRPKHKVGEYRFTRGYVYFLVALVFLVSGVPGVIISNSTNGYLLQRQADLQIQHINQEIETKDSKIKSFVNIFLMDASSKKEQNDVLMSLVEKKNSKDIFLSSFPSEFIADETPTDTQWIQFVNASNEANYTDNLIDHIFRKMAFQSDFGTQLSYLAKIEELSTDKSESKLIYRPDGLMLAASNNNLGFVILSFIGLFVLLFQMLKHLVVKRMMGEHIPEHFRVVRPCDNFAGKGMSYPYLLKLSRTVDCQGVLLLNATTKLASNIFNELNLQLFNNKLHHINDCLERVNDLYLFEEEVKVALDKTAPEQVLIIAIYGLEQVSGDLKLSSQALSLLNSLHVNKRIKLVIVADTSPLYRLMHQQAYSGKFDPEIEPNIDLITGWTRLFSEFDKEYAWLPQQKNRLKNPVDIRKVVEYEAKGWQSLAQVKDKFYEYHNRVKQQKEEKDLAHYWMPEQVIEFFLVQAGPIYRRQWELCTINEKLALWQMASGASLNPSNAGVLEHLVRRGYIYRDKGWNIINESFTRFILSAESERTVASWLDKSSAGIWPILRIPIFTIFIVIVVVLYYSSGDSLTSFISIATATLGLIPLVLKNLNLVKGEALPETD